VPSPPPRPVPVVDTLLCLLEGPPDHSLPRIGPSAEVLQLVCRLLLAAPTWMNTCFVPRLVHLCVGNPVGGARVGGVFSRAASRTTGAGMSLVQLCTPAGRVVGSHDESGIRSPLMNALAVDPVVLSEALRLRLGA
jgi:hypothetical protein